MLFDHNKVKLKISNKDFGEIHKHMEMNNTFLNNQLTERLSKGKLVNILT